VWVTLPNIYIYVKGQLNEARGASHDNEPSLASLPSVGKESHVPPAAAVLCDMLAAAVLIHSNRVAAKIGCAVSTSLLAGDGISVLLVRILPVSPAAIVVGRRDTRYTGVPNVCYPPESENSSSSGGGESQSAISLG